jgi:hypothetical protein
MDENPPDHHNVAPNRSETGQSEAGPSRDARLRAHWPERVWRKSQEGNWYLNAEGFNLVVAYRGGAWTVFIRNRETDRGQAGRKTYPTLEAAKQAGFEALLWARGNL